MGKTWSIGLFMEKEGFSIQERPTNLVSFFSGRSLSKGRHHIHTYADPFLFEDNGVLYLFAEIQAVGQPGYINAWRYNDAWKDLGPVLKTTSHYSYPFVFRDNGNIYMIPETALEGEVNLWKFNKFPYDLTSVKTLVKGNYADSNVIHHNGTWYLFTSNTANDLLIFFSDNLLSELWQPHPLNPVINSNAISRNGGGITIYRDQLLRIAQKNTNGYGEGIVILNVTSLNKNHYKEEILVDDYKPAQDLEWQSKGHHHLSICSFKGNTFVAVDGCQQDIAINKFINGLYKLLGK